MAKTSGLASISEGRSDILKIDPRKLHIKEGWNSRDMKAQENIEHVDMLAQSIAAIGVKEPLTVYWEDGKAWVSNGECRLRAALRAIEHYKATDLKTVPVKAEDRYGNEADRIFSQIICNSGKPFNQLEQAKVFKKLLDLGWLQADIAKKSGLSGGRVSQILNLLTMPEPVKQMVNAGQVSTSLAMQTVQSAGPSQAESVLKAGLEAAKEEGKTKVTPTHIAATVPVSPVEKVDFKRAVTEAFEYADIDDSDSEVVVVKFPSDKWSVIAKMLNL